MGEQGARISEDWEAGREGGAGRVLEALSDTWDQRRHIEQDGISRDRKVREPGKKRKNVGQRRGSCCGPLRDQYLGTLPDLPANALSAAESNGARTSRHLGTRVEK